MNKVIALSSCMAFVVTLTGCDYVNSFLLSPEDKINSAFPASDGVQLARAALVGIKPDTTIEDYQTLIHFGSR